MKKKTYIFFILPAYFILTAFSIIPHHHHEESNICIAEAHCHTENDKHDHEDHHSHRHSAHGYEYCTLEFNMILPQNQKKIECKCVDCYGLHPNVLLIAFLHNEFEADIKSFDRGINYDPLFRRILFETILSSSKGLRAPPMV